MPILTVEIVGPAPRGVASRIADAAGEVFGAGPGTTWVRLHRITSADYAENGGGPPRGVRPVFASVLKRGVAGGPALEREAAALTAAIAKAVGRSVENVHVVYEPPAAGRLAFGGRLVPRKRAR